MIPGRTLGVSWALVGLSLLACVKSPAPVGRHTLAEMEDQCERTIAKGNAYTREGARRPKRKPEVVANCLPHAEIAVLRCEGQECFVRFAPRLGHDVRLRACMAENGVTATWTRVVNPSDRAPGEMPVTPSWMCGPVPR